MRAYLQAARKHRPILALPLPGAAARAVLDGALLSSKPAVGRRTWEDFLADEVGAPSESSSTEDGLKRRS